MASVAFNPSKIIRVGAGTYKDQQSGRIIKGIASQADAVKRFQGSSYYRPQTPTTPAPPPAAAPTPSVATPSAPEGTPSGPSTPTATPVDNSNGNLMSSQALFPSIRAMLPKNIENDPIYAYNLEQGNKELDRRLAARGLLGSGAELEASNQLVKGLQADAATRLSDTAQREADRLERIQQAEANRLQQRDDSNFNRQYQLLDLYLRQNPMEYAWKGLENYGDLNMNMAKSAANYLGNDYARVSSGGGGGGGTVVPPQLSSSAGLDYLRTAMRNQGGMDWLGAASKGFSTLAPILARFF